MEKQTKVQRNSCPYVNQWGKTCGNKCYLEFCWRHQTGQRFRPCLMNCGKWTRNKNQYCHCSTMSKTIEYKKGNSYTPVSELVLGSNLLNILESQ